MISTLNRPIRACLKGPVKFNHLQYRSFLSISNQQYRVKRKLNYSPELMFQIVSEVDKYEKFVPFVEESYINSKDDNGNPTEAGFRVGWNQFDEKFVCKISCNKNTKIKAESVTHSLFHNLSAEWNFKPVNNPFVKEKGCEVELVLEYKFKNPIYNVASSLFSEQATKIMIKAFEKRARDVKSKVHLRPKLY